MSLIVVVAVVRCCRFRCCYFYCCCYCCCCSDQGYALRELKDDFLKKYKVLQPEAKDVETLVTYLSNMLNASQKDWQIGTSKVLDCLLAWNSWCGWPVWFTRYTRLLPQP